MRPLDALLLGLRPLVVGEGLLRLCHCPGRGRRGGEPGQPARALPSLSLGGVGGERISDFMVRGSLLSDGMLEAPPPSNRC